MSFLKKLGRSKNKERSLTNRTTADQEADSVLADDDDKDSFSVNITGTLGLDLNVPDEDSDPNTVVTPTFDGQNSQLFSGDSELVEDHVTFEVTSAEVIREQRQSYVLYTILITSSSGQDKVPVTVERRYSDFEKLHSHLKRRFPDVMDSVSFPRKILVGNFSSETIAHRSRAFEQYLSHVYSMYDIRYSNELAAFFYLNEAKDACYLVCEGQYSEAITWLEKCLPISEKLYGCSHTRVISILHALVVSYHAIDKLRVAQKYAEAALRSTKESSVDEASIALIKLSIRLCWSIGKDKQDLEKRLQDLKDKKINTDSVPELKDIVRNSTLA